MQSKTFISVQEVAEELGVSKSYAYRVAKQLDEELKQQGYLTVAGRVNAQYFYKKICYNERHV
ncbi:MAG: DNA-binding protein [Clostridiaceae bacterium]|nr:DNA-binding protein [Clostridiaceae bacterium]